MTALDDAGLDRLLACDRPPPMRASLADRIAAEAMRSDRVPALAVTLPRRPRRRLWARPRFIAGFVAFNLVAASAVAAAIGGNVIAIPKIDVPQLAALSTKIFQRDQKAAPAVHRAPKAKPPAPKQAPAFAEAAPPSEELDGAPPSDGVRPGWAMRRDVMAARALAREQRREHRLEQRRERVLALAQMSRAERLRAIEQARKARALVREQRFALRRDEIAPSAEALETMRRELEPRRAELARLRADLRAVRRLERLRRYQEWRERIERRQPSGADD
jgi:hypothetical protein